jgi:predicted nicotinamide N-methyase
MPEPTRGPVVAGLQLRWHELGFFVVDDPDVLLDRITQEEFESTDERMPYFGALWPSAEALVRAILGMGGVAGDEARVREDDDWAGKRVLDLGCGLGACGIAAARRGARVTFLDWEPRALAIVEASLAAPTPKVDACELVVADWRSPPPLAPFDRILGADVLYEKRNAPAVAAFLAAHLAPGAEAWIADQGRPHARAFPSLAQQAGLEFLGGEILPARPQGIEITRLRVRRPR